MLKSIALFIWLTLCAAACAQTYQVSFNDEDPIFETGSSAWTIDRSTTAIGGYRFARTGPGDGSARAVWTIDGIPSGTYDVEFYIGDSGAYATAAEYIVESAAGVTTLTKSQSGVTGWQTLGTFEFRYSGRVTQTDRALPAGVKVIADGLRLTLHGTPTAPTLNVAPPTIGMCIDDIGGENPDSAATMTYQLFRDAPGFTYAVMPARTYTAQSLQKASSLGIETILHQPMQYLGQTNLTDANTLYVSLTDAQIRTRLNAHLDLGPQFLGTNNHQGSQFSEYRHGMDVVTGELRNRNLIYYDSRTISDSTGYDAAKAAGLLTTERDMFIDNDDPVITRDNIVSLANRAKYAPNSSQNGIGHNRVNTVPGIRDALPIVAGMGVEVRPISRQALYVIEPDAMPPGTQFNSAAAITSSSADLMAKECSNGDALLMQCNESYTANGTFTFNVPRTGKYRVFAGYVENASNCDAVRYQILGVGAPQAITVNQQIEGNRWHYLGTVGFAASTPSSITIAGALCRHLVQVDGIKLQYDGPFTSAVDEWEKY